MTTTDFAFTGSLSCRYDGENTEGEGTVQLLGRRQRITFGGSASYRGVAFQIAGEDVDPDGALAGDLEEYLFEIWPEADGSWDATVEAGTVISLTKVTS
jgi:hypothetical protein